MGQRQQLDWQRTVQLVNGQGRASCSAESMGELAGELLGGGNGVEEANKQDVGPVGFSNFYIYIYMNIIK